MKSLKRERRRVRNKLREFENMAIPNHKMIKSLRKHLAQINDQINNYRGTTPTERRLTKARRRAEQSRASVTRGTPIRNVTRIRDSLKRHRVAYRKGIANMPPAEKDKILMRSEAYRNMAKDVPADVRRYMIKRKVFGNQMYRAISIPGAPRVDAPIWNAYKSKARSMKKKLSWAEQYLAKFQRQGAEPPLLSPGLLNIYGSLGSRIAANNPQYTPAQVSRSVARYVAGKAAGGGPGFEPQDGAEPSHAVVEVPKKKDLPGWLVPAAAAGMLLLGSGAF